MTYAHERSGFFVSKNARHSPLLAPEVASGGFTDVAADGQDREDEQRSESMGSAQQVLRNEEALKRRLEGSLEQEQAQNSLLKQRLAKQESAMRCGRPVKDSFLPEHACHPPGFGSWQRHGLLTSLVAK